MKIIREAISSKDHAAITKAVASAVKDMSEDYSSGMTVGERANNLGHELAAAIIHGLIWGEKLVDYGEGPDTQARRGLAVRGYTSALAKALSVYR